MISTLTLRAGFLGVASLALAATLVGVPGIVAHAKGQVGRDIFSVKAGFLFNFAKFTEWPTLSSSATILMCVVGDERIAAALAETVRDQRISDHSLEVSRAQDSATWRTCHVLFIAETELRRSAVGLDTIRSVHVLTVSDAKDFSQTGGIIEFYIDSGKMRFAINVDAADRSGVRLSSRLLGLAKIVRDQHVP
jgi:hypothetical protein